MQGVEDDFMFLICMFVSVKIAFGHLGRPRSRHTAPMPAPMGSVHALLITKPCAGLALSRSESVEPGATTCVFGGAAGPCLKSLEHTHLVSATTTSIVYHNVSFLFWIKLCRSRPQPTLQVGRPNVYHVDSVPETCCK